MNDVGTEKRLKSNEENESDSRRTFTRQLPLCEGLVPRVFAATWSFISAQQPVWCPMMPCVTEGNASLPCLAR